jgi:hypothetical protein
LPARIALVLLLVAALVAGCGAGGKRISEAKLSRLVLREQDLPPIFSSFNFGKQIRLDNSGTARADPVRYGRKGGWIARYNRPGSSDTRGPLVIESRADLFDDAGGAKSDLAAYRIDFSRIPGSDLRVLSLPKLGDAALGVTFVQPGAKPVRFFRIAWRDRNVSASVTVQGFGGRLALTEALALARKQERLISNS